MLTVTIQDHVHEINRRLITSAADLLNLQTGFVLINTQLNAALLADPDSMIHKCTIQRYSCDLIGIKYNISVVRIKAYQVYQS